MICKNGHPQPLIFQYSCGSDQTPNSSKSQGSDLGLDEVCSKSDEQSQNTGDCSPQFYLCSSLKRRFFEVPAFIGHLADGAPFGEHGNAMSREKYADNAEA